MAKLILYKVFALEKLQEFAYENKCYNKWLSEIPTLGWNHRPCGRWNTNIQQCHVAVSDFSFFRKQLKFSHREQSFLNGQSFPDKHLNLYQLPEFSSWVWTGKPMNAWVQLLLVSCVLCGVVHPSVDCIVCFLAFSELVLLDFRVGISSQPYLPEA